MESEAVCVVMELCAGGAHQWVSSEAIEEELLRDPDVDRRAILTEILRFADERLVVGEPSIRIAEELVARGISAMDALHLALAVQGRCDVLLTTDDKLIRRAGELRPPLQLKVENPVQWVLTESQHDA